MLRNLGTTREERTRDKESQTLEGGGQYASVFYVIPSS